MHDDGSHEETIRQILRNWMLEADGVIILLDWKRLARQGSFVYVQVFALENSNVGWDNVSNVNRNQVTWH